ncbi:uncharacterized protein LOC131856805 [Cryptomeria japonica]|uniref:uncharacterized protein LOC131856805 n=1 Tax=Cryptomeria japonica TaxID=3369 RepID=UPI0027DA8405|nr:uncharacterized protein LOC131856805 [Cryptomeria japonica]
MVGNPAIGASGGLAIIWDPRVVSFEVVNSQAHWMSDWVKGIKKNLCFLLVNVYGPTQNKDKRKIWSELKLFLKAIPNQICIIGGDFNAILNPKEKWGGIRKISRSKKYFCEWVHRINLMEIKTMKDTYNWNNRRSGFSFIAEKLDRFFLWGSLIDFPNSLYAEFLPISGSNHYPIQLSITEESKPRRCPFKFELMWMKEDKIMGLVEKWWKEMEITVSEIFGVISNLKVVKNNLLRWNKMHFGNIFETKARLEDETSALNKIFMENEMDQALFLEEKWLLANYEDILAKEKVFWHQKSREFWLSDGDRNTKFFHNSTKQRRTVNRITKIKTSEGKTIEDPNLITSKVVKYFENILNNWEGSNLSFRDDILANIPKIVTEAQNKNLGARFTKEKVKIALM